MQTELFALEEVAAVPEATESLRALDELFLIAGQFSDRSAYGELLRFIARFRAYSPYNAMLIHTQMPGARYVATPRRWLHDYGRKIVPGARPITILQPKGPVLFVFDVSDTTPMAGAPALPQSVTNPFAVLSGTEKGELAKTIDNAMRDGVRVRGCEYGSQQAGQIQTADGTAAFHLTDGSLFKPRKVAVPISYDLLLNARQTAAEQYATLVHELGHLYCGHLGSRNEKFWPHRPGLGRQIEECEAESVSYLVCTRRGIQTPSARYVAGYLTEDGEMPKISLDAVVKMAGLIHQMGQSRLPLRKEGKGAETS